MPRPFLVRVPGTAFWQRRPLRRFFAQSQHEKWRELCCSTLGKKRSFVVIKSIEIEFVQAHQHLQMVSGEVHDSLRRNGFTCSRCPQEHRVAMTWLTAQLPAMIAALHNVEWWRRNFDDSKYRVMLGIVSLFAFVCSYIVIINHKR